LDVFEVTYLPRTGGNATSLQSIRSYLRRSVNCVRSLRSLLSRGCDAVTAGCLGVLRMIRAVSRGWGVARATEAPGHRRLNAARLMRLSPTGDNLIFVGRRRRRFRWMEIDCARHNQAISRLGGRRWCAREMTLTRRLSLAVYRAADFARAVALRCAALD